MLYCVFLGNNDMKSLYVLRTTLIFWNTLHPWLRLSPQSPRYRGQPYIKQRHVYGSICVVIVMIKTLLPLLGSALQRWMLDKHWSWEIWGKNCDSDNASLSRTSQVTLPLTRTRVSAGSWSPGGQLVEKVVHHSWAEGRSLTPQKNSVALCCHRRWPCGAGQKARKFKMWALKRTQQQ